MSDYYDLHVGWLAAGNLNHLPADPVPFDPLPDEADLWERTPCCSSCCAPCGAIMAMADNGMLDIALEEYGPGWDWWDDQASQVDRAWLNARIGPRCVYAVLSGLPRWCDEEASRPVVLGEPEAPA